MAAVYSTRFLLQQGLHVNTYLVPAGAVAVIRCVTVHNDDTSAVQHCILAILPLAVDVVYAIEPAQQFTSQNVSRALDLRVVVLGGETMRLDTSAGVHASVSGYLFLN